MPLATLLLAAAATVSLARGANIPASTSSSNSSFPKFWAAAQPPAASLPLDGSFLSYSIEPAFWNYFVGENKQPNHFLFDTRSHVVARTGVTPIIRPGGATMDLSHYDPSSNGTATRDMADDGSLRALIYEKGF
jgi:hypothetical protein